MILIVGIVAIVYFIQITVAPDDILVDFVEIGTQLWECMKPQNQRRNLGARFCKQTTEIIQVLPAEIFELPEINNHVLICVAEQI